MHSTIDETTKLKVFVSYSRKDIAFADEIAAGLELQGDFEVLIDRDAIHEGEDWKARLGHLIAAADTIVFILSPASAASPICQWEVETAERLSKRILPVQSTPLEGTRPPPQLSALNYVRFDPHEDGRARSFVAGLAGLYRALKTDIEWLREHTRYLTRAQEWQQAGRPDNRLLIGSDVVDARRWLERQPKDAPPPSESHHDFITASERAEAERTGAERERARRLQRAIFRTQWALAIALALAMIAGLFGYQATQERKRADRERDSTLLTQSRYLAGFSQESRLKGQIGNAIALARRALPVDLNDPDRPIASEALQALYDAAAERRYNIKSLRGHAKPVRGALLLKDGGLLTWSADRTARVWTADGTPGPILKGHAGFLRGALELKDGRLLTWSFDKTARLWAADGTPGPILKGHTGFLRGALELKDGRILTWSADKAARLWAGDGSPGPVLRGHIHNVLGALELQDGRLLTWSRDKTARLWADDGTAGPILRGHVSPTGVSRALELKDGRLLTWSFDKTARLWFRDGTPGPVLSGHTGSVVGALELKERRLLTWSADETARLWTGNGMPGAVLRRQRRGRHRRFVRDVLELKDGRLLTWGDERTARLWARDGTPGPELKGHTGLVRGALELNNGRLLTWSLDKTARLWAGNGTPGPILKGHTGLIDGALELRDGRVLTWSYDNTARLWQPDASRLIAWADRVIDDTDPLSLRESCQYFLEPAKKCTGDRK